LNLETLLKNDKFVKCPKCSYCFEIVKKSKEEVEDDLIKLKLMHELEDIHKEMNRIRCRECEIDFCAKCLASPYHEKFTCESVKFLFSFIASSKHLKNLKNVDFVSNQFPHPMQFVMRKNAKKKVKLHAIKN
jgi:hypothetical protein